MLNNGSIVSKVGFISEHDLDAVAVKVEDSSIEVIKALGAAGRCSVGTASSGQGRSVEFSNRRPVTGGEGNVCGAGFYAVQVS